MSNLTAIQLPVYIVGDGVSLTAVVDLLNTVYALSGVQNLNSHPIAAASTASFDSQGADVSSNIFSVAVTGSQVTITFVAAFTGQVEVVLSLSYPVTGSPLSTPVNSASQAIGTNLHAVLDAGTAVIGHVISDSGSTTVVTGAVAVTGTFWQATQPISGAVSFTAPQHVISDAGSVVNATLSAETTKVIGTIRVEGNVGGVLDAVITAATAPANGLATLGVYNSTVPVLTTGQSAASQADTTGSQYVTTEGRKQTYRTSFWNFTPLASLNSPCVSIHGSATKTVRITHISVSWSCTTGLAAASTISLQKYSALSGGTVNNPGSPTPNDSTNAAATAVGVQYSVVPSVFTKVGSQSALQRVCWITSGATVNATPTSIDWVFGEAHGQPLVLRGISEFFGILIDTVGTSPIMDVCIEFTEE